MKILIPRNNLTNFVARQIQDFEEGVYVRQTYLEMTKLNAIQSTIIDAIGAGWDWTLCQIFGCEWRLYSERKNSDGSTIIAECCDKCDNWRETKHVAITEGK